MSGVATFADSVGRIGGISISVWRARIKEFAARHLLALPSFIDTLGTLLWDLPDQTKPDDFANALKGESSVPCLGRSLRHLRALREFAELVGNQRFGERYVSRNHRITQGDEIWEIGIGLSSAPLTNPFSSRCSRVELLQMAGPREVVLRKVYLKPPGSKLDWGKTIVKMLKPMAASADGIVMCRGLTAIDTLLAGGTEAPESARQLYVAKDNADAETPLEWLAEYTRRTIDVSR